MSSSDLVSEHKQDKNHEVFVSFVFQGNLGPGVQDLSALRTPHGGIRTAKKTKQQKKEDMHNKKRSRKVLNKQLMSMDFGQMAPPESESSDDDMFTGIAK